MPDAPALVGVGRDRAAQAIAARFSRLMNASTSPFGVLGDPASAGVPTAIFFVAYLVARSRDAAPDVVRSLGLLSFAPLLVVVVSSLALIGARARVIAWLAGLPFPLENVNALLNGIGSELEVRFADPADPAPASDWPPSREATNALLDAVSPDVFVMSIGEEERVLEVRIGVIDSKLNPARSNHQRFARVRAICERVLVPLSTTRPILSVRVK